MAARRRPSMTQQLLESDYVHIVRRQQQPGVTPRHPVARVRFRLELARAYVMGHLGAYHQLWLAIEPWLVSENDPGYRTVKHRAAPSPAQRRRWVETLRLLENDAAWLLKCTRGARQRLEAADDGEAWLRRQLEGLGKEGA